jgi:hypothetical protein
MRWSVASSSTMFEDSIVCLAQCGETYQIGRRRSRIIQSICTPGAAC